MGADPLHEPPALSECERVSAHAGLEELDFKRPIHDFSGLTNELIKAIVVEVSPPVLVCVIAVVGPWRVAVNQDAKANGMSLRTTGQYKMKIACVKSIGDAARCIVQRGVFAGDCPNTAQAPMVDR